MTIQVFSLFNFVDKKYEQVRKLFDSRTLVGLARTQEVDDRFFNPFPIPDKYEVSLLNFTVPRILSVC